jgi:hypothetical protein
MAFGVPLIPFILIVVSSLAQTTHAAAAYQLTRLQVPAANSRAVALNDSGTVLGVAEDQGRSRIFFWRNDTVTFLDGVGDVATPFALNNRGDIVGEARVVNINRPFLYSNGIISILGPEPGYQEDDAARAINDDGVVVGNVGAIGYLLAPQQVAYPQPGGGPCFTGTARLISIDNSGAVLGSVDGASYRWPSFHDRSKYEYLPINAVALHGSNVVGSVDGNPALLRGTNLIMLSAPVTGGTAVAINDAGLVVGSSTENSTALIWNGPFALELGSLVDLPSGARLVSAVAINKTGQIAATLYSERTAIPVLLTPSSSIAPSSISIQMPEKKLFTREPITLPVQFSSEAEITQVTYITYKRSLTPSFGTPPCGWTPPRIDSAPVATNSLTQPPFSLLLTNLPSGQYTFQASVRYNDGATAISFPGYFAVAGRPAVRIQKNWADQLEVALDGSPGYLQVLEVSTNLTDWTPLSNQAPVEGIIYLEAATAWHASTARFYRAKVVAESMDSFGSSPIFSYPPYFADRLTNTRFTFRYEDGTSSTAEFTTATQGIWASRFPFEYTWNFPAHTIQLSGGDWQSQITLIPAPLSEFLFFVGPFWNSGTFVERLTTVESTITQTGTYNMF